MTDFYYNYIKYKHKYINLKNNTNPNYNLLGGALKTIIHISGPSGAGKTTLGNKLKYKYDNKIVVKDIDDLRFEFIKKEYPKFKIDKWNPEKYQEYINEFIKKNNKKPIVFVGLNHMPWLSKRLYYDMHPDHKFYIKLNTKTIFEQKCSRFIEDVFVKSKEQMLKDIVKDEKTIIKHVINRYKDDCSYEKTQKINEIWNKDYKLQGYKFLSRDHIFENVCDILDDVL
jgi:adenylate kinase family enzyme